MVTSRGEAEIIIQDIAVVSPSRLLVSDNNKLRLVDIVNGGVLSHVSLPGWSRGVCLLGGGGAAVVLSWVKKILCVRINGDNLSLDRSIDVKEYPLGISAFDSSNIVVSYHNPGRVEMMTMGGRVIDAVDNQKARKQLFKYPYFIATSNNNNIFVSDCGTKTITQMDVSLQITRIFTSPMMTSPCGIFFVSTEQLLVANRASHCIVVLNPTNGSVMPLLGRAYGIQKPRAMAWCPASKKLYVSRDGRHTAVNVFCLK